MEIERLIQAAIRTPLPSVPVTFFAFQTHATNSTLSRETASNRPEQSHYSVASLTPSFLIYHWSFDAARLYDSIRNSALQVVRGPSLTT